MDGHLLAQDIIVGSTEPVNCRRFYCISLLRLDHCRDCRHVELWLFLLIVAVLHIEEDIQRLLELCSIELILFLWRG